MVWGGILTIAPAELNVFQRGSLTARRYLDVVQERQVRLLRSTVGMEFSLSDNTARPHRSSVMSEYFLT
ncbi:hypothetical protein TNCV_672921 [Trichonephila clavipes]|nr:hypothetical protein TNCV_672921 [Trichonephila clavipes]